MLLVLTELILKLALSENIISLSLKWDFSNFIQSFISNKVRWNSFLQYIVSVSRAVGFSSSWSGCSLTSNERRWANLKVFYRPLYNVTLGDFSFSCNIVFSKYVFFLCIKDIIFKQYPVEMNLLLMLQTINGITLYKT